MPDREAFLQTIYDSPDDDNPRLVYADWLEEQGDPYAEFIRVQVELAQTAPCKCFSQGYVAGVATKTKYTKMPPCRFCELVDRQRELMPRTDDRFRVSVVFSETAFTVHGSKRNLDRFVHETLIANGFDLRSGLESLPKHEDKANRRTTYYQDTNVSLVFHRGFEFGLAVDDGSWVRLAEKLMKKWPLVRQIHLPRVPNTYRLSPDGFRTDAPSPGTLLARVGVAGRPVGRYTEHWRDVTDRQIVQEEWPAMQFFYPEPVPYIYVEELMRHNERHRAPWTIRDAAQRAQDDIDSTVAGSMHGRTLE